MADEGSGFVVVGARSVTLDWLTINEHSSFELVGFVVEGAAPALFGLKSGVLMLEPGFMPSKNAYVFEAFVAENRSWKRRKFERGAANTMSAARRDVLSAQIERIGVASFHPASVHGMGGLEKLFRDYLVYAARRILSLCDVS